MTNDVWSDHGKYENTWSKIEKFVQALCIWGSPSNANGIASLNCHAQRLEQESGGSLLPIYISNSRAQFPHELEAHLTPRTHCFHSDGLNDVAPRKLIVII